MKNFTATIVPNEEGLEEFEHEFEALDYEDAAEYIIKFCFAGNCNYMNLNQTD